MSINWTKDIYDMHAHYGVHAAVNGMDKEKLKEYLKFRINFIDEEFQELKTAAFGSDNVDAEEVVDALIDICVVAIGTLDVFGVNPYLAWDEVLRANMNKVVGVKESRPNALGLPDLIKPSDWTPPSHANNHGKLNAL